jgi:hypothetical protein
MSSVPTSALDEAYQQCHPDRPLLNNDARWTDLSPARGDDAFGSLERRLRLDLPDEPQHLLLYSHRGAGKTTELNRLIARLDDRLSAVMVEANTTLDPQHVEAEELLLAIALSVHEHMRILECPISPEALAPVERWFAEQVRTTTFGHATESSTTGTGAGGVRLPFFGRLGVDMLAVFRTQAAEQNEIRAAFRQRPASLVAAVNEVLKAANAQLDRRSPSRRLLVVIDNLDRYQPEVVDALLAGRGGLLRDLNVKLVLTPPVSLLYRPLSEDLAGLYDWEVMSTLRLRRHDQGYDQFDGPGRDLMVDALLRRFDVQRLIPDTATVDRLVSASGGAMRDLLHLVQRSILISSGAASHIERGAVERAIARECTQKRDLINMNGWMGTLRAIAKEKQLLHDDQCIKVLHHRLAFKYNGAGWYDVHPLVAELPEFRA